MRLQTWGIAKVLYGLHVYYTHYRGVDRFLEFRDCAHELTAGVIKLHVHLNRRQTARLYKPLKFWEKLPDKKHRCISTCIIDRGNSHGVNRLVYIIGKQIFNAIICLTNCFYVKEDAINDPVNRIFAKFVASCSLPVAVSGNYLNQM